MTEYIDTSIVVKWFNLIGGKSPSDRWGMKAASFI